LRQRRPVRRDLFPAQQFYLLEDAPPSEAAAVARGTVDADFIDQFASKFRQAALNGTRCRASGIVVVASPNRTHFP
jgi:hypothetical protein